MNRRWSFAYVGFTLSVIVSLACPSLQAAEFRGRGTSRTAHRAAAHQEDLLPEPAMEAEEALPEAAPRPQAANKAPAPSVRRAPPTNYVPPTTTQWDEGWVDDPHGGDGSCADGSCGTTDYFGSPADCWHPCGTWGSIEYLVWWRSGRDIPPLVTTATAVVDQDTDGQIGQANTARLLTSEQLGDRLLPGGRFDIGVWLDDCHSQGLGLRFTALGDDDLNYTTNSTVNPVLAIPFFNLDPAVNNEDTLLVAHPLDGTTGSVNVTGHNETYATDVYLRFAGVRTCDYRLDVIGGYFFSRINEDLTLSTSTTTANTVIALRDTFQAKNEYHGGSIGLLGAFDRELYRVNILAKVAMANVNETLTVDGLNTVDGVVQAPRAGLFAQPSNIGTRSRSEFAVIPEAGINFAYKFTPRIEATFGYSMMYWSKAIRPGDQFNRRIDPTQALALPQPTFTTTGYWVQGMNFGLQCSY